MRTTIAFISSLVLAISAQAQVSIYISANYGIPVGGEALGSIVDYQSSNSYLEEALVRSYGQGIQGQAGIKYMLSQLVGADVQLGLLKNEFLSNSYEDDDDLETTRYKTSQLSLRPGLVIETPGDGMKLYSRFGLVIPISTNIVEVTEDIQKDYFYNNGEYRDRTISLEAEWKTSLSVGFQGSVGVIVPVGAVQIFAEANVQSLTLRAASRSIVFYEDDGDDQLREIPTSTKEVLFMREITEDSNREYNSNFDSDDPSEEVAPSLPFSNAGISVGLVIPLGE